MSIDKPFYFLRHGETSWNLERRTQGQLDSQLNETGQAQALRAAEVLKAEPLQHIVASPLSRVRHTAEAVASHHDIEIEYSDALKECHLGELQGKPHDDRLRQYWGGHFDPPGGETYGTFAARVWQAMADAVRGRDNVLIVCHGGLWRAAHDYVGIEPPLLPMPNALPVHVTPKNGVWFNRVLDPER